jgi:hypothetical protein
MSSSIRTKTSADTEQAQLKLKLERYRSNHNPQKSILKSGESAAAVLSAPQNASGTRIFSNENAHPALAITPKFTAPDSSTSKLRSRPTEPNAVAAEGHLHTILQKVLTAANSLANTGKIQEVIHTLHSRREPPPD